MHVERHEDYELLEALRTLKGLAYGEQKCNASLSMSFNLSSNCCTPHTTLTTSPSHSMGTSTTFTTRLPGFPWRAALAFK